MKFSKKLFLFIFFTFLLVFLITAKAEAKQTDAPTVLEVGEQQVMNLPNQLYLKGLTPKNTAVLIYIDGTYVDLARVSEEDTEVNSFYYAHSSALSGGNHIILVIAQDKTSLVLSAPVETEFIIPPLSAPTLLEIVKSGDNIIFKGLTVSSSIVHFYIDGGYYGATETLRHESGTAGFIYSPDFKMTSANHQVWVIAEDEQGRKSIKSNVLMPGEVYKEPEEVIVDEIEDEIIVKDDSENGAKIILATPAPILFAPVVNSKSSYNQPFIVGLAKNDLAIKIYIDEDLAGEFMVENHESGTANFAFQPAEILERGQYEISAISIDSTGKESKLSEIIDFIVNKPTIARSAQEATTEKEDLIVNATSQLSKDKENLSEDSIDEDIGQIVNESIIEETDEGGLVDESKKGQGKLSLNLVIFLAFLLGVIAWIFWVNKELIKERREDSNNSKKDKLN